jgi:DUF4097 and DUF4098 domain-containing protein YvlB
MLAHAILIGLGSFVPTAAPADTTFTVPSGAKVEIINVRGDIEIRAGSGREARVLADGESDRVRVARSGNVFRIEPRSRRWEDDADLVIRLPADVSIDVQGGSGDVIVAGFRSAVTVQALDGDIDVDGATALAIHSVDGDVQVSDASGPVTIEMGDGDAALARVGGPIVVHGIDGDITILQGDAAEVVLSTVSGDLRYDGRVHSDGTYELATHDGDVTFAIGEGVGARVSVLTYDGALIPSFPIQLRGSVGSIAEFTLGSGSARVQLESFDGDIHLIRPGERSP